MDHDLSRVADHFVVLVDVGGPEVNEDVDDEHDVDDEVDDCQGVAVSTLDALVGGFLFFFTQDERGGIRSEDSGVDD